MIKKRLVLGLTFLVCIFTLGCSKVENTSKEDDSKKISTEHNTNKDTANKISFNDSLSEVKDKMYNACIYDSQDQPIKTMEEAKEYVKNILPDGIKEIESKYSEDKGVTYAKYGTEDFVYYVCYIHPYKPLENNIKNYDLNTVSGIKFKRVEINSNWESSK
ncbi:hypothetical protein [Paraclostridium bifermentans]|uniref:hypothetical protein n=1 Tax=Paraclostridium bifermentans TaxID=1490 RepID=UPI001C800BDA|nr:hypothetical protein [Paraclostridium bifermentans]GIM32228.1 hypothetical protein PAGU1678_14980 [Paraclostridium bifermentans subsp. muricolitidis]